MALLGPALGAAAKPPQPAPVDRADRTDPAHGGRPVPKNKPPATDAPGADLLDWLGRYEDAGDGLDPLGLDDLAGPARDPKDRQQ